VVFLNFLVTPQLMFFDATSPALPVSVCPWVQVYSNVRGPRTILELFSAGGGAWHKKGVDQSFR